jgi:hypothetical protein
MKKYTVSDSDRIQQHKTYMMQNGDFLGEQRISIDGRRRWLSLIVLCLGALMIVLDFLRAAFEQSKKEAEHHNSGESQIFITRGEIHESRNARKMALD